MTTHLPQVDRVLRHPVLADLKATMRADILTALVRRHIQNLRRATAGARERAEGVQVEGGPVSFHGNYPDQSPEADGVTAESVATSVAAAAADLLKPSLRKVINGTGVVLNTNLGRAPLARQALKQVLSVADGYCNLEIDLQTGKRGKRSARVSELLCLLSGAEAALVVNNNAAAIVLAVNALARDKEVLVSRGELIEIGGSFRLPDVIEAAGARLKEVGTTNKTRIGDFQNALSPASALLMRCHRSNFEIRGFTQTVSLAELVALGKQYEVPVLEDLGSGILYPQEYGGLAEEPSVAATVSSGCDLVCFSGDKLLGGPQAGIVVGRTAIIEKLAKHPLYRALRLDKLTLALLEQTLIAHLRPASDSALPTLSMINMPVEALEERATNFAGTISDASSLIECRTLKTSAATGGGSLPGQTVESHGITLSVAGTSASKLAALLRQAEPPVISTIQNEKVLLDFRTISPCEEKMLYDAILSTLSNR